VLLEEGAHIEKNSDVERGVDQWGALYRELLAP